MPSLVLVITHAHRQQVSDKYSRKIELLVRKPDRGDEPPEGLTPCPYCNLPGPECQLQCVSCQSIIPFDIATGAGVVRGPNGVLRWLRCRG